MRAITAPATAMNDSTANKLRGTLPLNIGRTTSAPENTAAIAPSLIDHALRKMCFQSLCNLMLFTLINRLLHVRLNNETLNLARVSQPGKDVFHQKISQRRCGISFPDLARCWRNQVDVDNQVDDSAAHPIRRI